MTELSPRIVDLVFSREDRRRRTRVVAALLLGLGVHLGAVAGGVLSGPSLETWSAELATRVHGELTREEVVELPPQKPPEPPAPPPPAPKSAPPSPTAIRQPHAEKRAAPPPSAPAQAGRIIAADPSAPVDLPGATFVTGSARAYAGGVTASTGTSKTAVTGPVSTAPPPAPPPPRRVYPKVEDLSSLVALDSTDWICPWPKEADAEQIDEQAVIIKVVVDSDGSARSVQTLSDPGHGFAAAVRACALASRFSPARDREGHAVLAESPPIRVHFTR